jgi:hypothetical protein
MPKSLQSRQNFSNIIFMKKLLFFIGVLFTVTNLANAQCLTSDHLALGAHDYGYNSAGELQEDVWLTITTPTDGRTITYVELGITYQVSSEADFVTYEQTSYDPNVTSLTLNGLQRPTDCIGVRYDGLVIFSDESIEQVRYGEGTLSWTCPGN